MQSLESRGPVDRKDLLIFQQDFFEAVFDFFDVAADDLWIPDAGDIITTNAFNNGAILLE